MKPVNVFPSIERFSVPAGDYRKLDNAELESLQEKFDSVSGFGLLVQPADCVPLPDSCEYESDGRFMLVPLAEQASLVTVSNGMFTLIFALFVLIMTLSSRALDWLLLSVALGIMACALGMIFFGMLKNRAGTGALIFDRQQHSVYFPALPLTDSFVLDYGEVVWMLQQKGGGNGWVELEIVPLVKFNSFWANMTRYRIYAGRQTLMSTLADFKQSTLLESFGDDKYDLIKEEYADDRFYTAETICQFINRFMDKEREVPEIYPFYNSVSWYKSNNTTIPHIHNLIHNKKLKQDLFDNINLAELLAKYKVPVNRYYLKSKT